MKDIYILSIYIFCKRYSKTYMNSIYIYVFYLMLGTPWMPAYLLCLSIATAVLQPNLLVPTPSSSTLYFPSSASHPCIHGVVHAITSAVHPMPQKNCPNGLVESLRWMHGWMDGGEERERPSKSRQGNVQQNQIRQKIMHAEN